MAPANRRRPRFDPRLLAWGLNDQQPAPRRTVGVNDVHWSAGGSRARVYLMSALPPKADMCCAVANVCFGPKADMCGAKRMSAMGQWRTFKCRGQFDPSRLRPERTAQHQTRWPRLRR